MKALALIALVLSGCSALPPSTSLNAECVHVSHPGVGFPWGSRTEEDSIDACGFSGRLQTGRVYVDAGLSYSLADGGFYGPDLIFTGRVGVRLFGSDRQ